MFIQEVRKEKIPDRHKMISFDVISLFTNLPLDEIIEIILENAFNEKKTETSIPKSILKKL